jgi:hypothetical protein
MVFQYGKTYRHTSGDILSIVGIANTRTYGKCLIGEDQNGNLKPIGQSEDNTEGYVKLEGRDSDTVYHDAANNKRCKKCPYYISYPTREWIIGIDLAPEEDVSAKLEPELSKTCSGCYFALSGDCTNPQPCYKDSCGYYTEYAKIKEI